MTAWLLCAALLAQGEPASVVGMVRLTKAVGAPLVSVVGEDDSAVLEGDLTAEIARLQSARVEVAGLRDGEKIVVKSYQIVDIKGAKPRVGRLVKTAGGFALRETVGEDSSDIPLSLDPRSKQKLHDKDGAKVWVHGKLLLSGELKVLRYGVLRDPVVTQDSP
ncbi:MAG: hypothetical protein A2289_25555 [Deltaproteobacteria bacterium RIFOXYA12_FULL_58_15]|nr:MAG: hypothetical protein A2289_25555 [Deltaproteobacteria bacterium RIFOXYA12_FULL_58_15]OGR14923.1 MAG: hypothetical protein A2341_03675 [Deltaproteobacteria bacterium RIFOXYB12_FULL_58_9]